MGLTVGNLNECVGSLECIVVGSWKNDLIGSEDGEW